MIGRNIVFVSVALFSDLSLYHFHTGAYAFWSIGLAYLGTSRSGNLRRWRVNDLNRNSNEEIWLMDFFFFSLLFFLAYSGRSYVGFIPSPKV
jgi:hypothetical protein